MSHSYSVPDGWTVQDLSTVAEFLDSKRRPIKESDRARIRGEVPYYGATGIVGHVTEHIFNEELILLGEDGENILSRKSRQAFIISGKSWVNNHAHVLRPRVGVNINYLCEFLESLDYTDFNTGTAQPKINKQVCSTIQILLPPIEEQRAIASALSDMDALLAKLDQLIAKKRGVKQAAMQELLTRYSKPRTAGTLRDVIADLEAGVSVNSVDHENPGSTGQPCILKTSAIYDGEFNPAECKLIDTQDTNRARLSPRKDTILVSRMNTPNLVGEVGYIANDYPNLYLPDRLWMTRFHQGAKVCPRWLAYVLSSTHIKEKIKGLATGTSGSMKNISKGALLGLELAFPVLEEQIEIAMILSDMDTEITALEARREKTRLIKQGMMQELLSGRVRLI